MQYLYLVYHNEKDLDALSGREYDDELKRGGHYIASNALEGAETATTVRVRGGRSRSLTAPSRRRRSNWAG